MTTIDQRILIPAGPEAVWEQLSNIANNPNWQIDCKSISFLSSRREGPGVRWRYTSDKGRDYVLETTAWYDGLGYEYTIVDGAAYRQVRGRIRLQEIPEGTIVQWTFSYELPGVLGGLRNAMSVRRGLENTMAESLRMLWRKVNEKRDSSQSHEAKSLMRDALDYEARSRYKSRHTSAAPESQDDTHERFRPDAARSESPAQPAQPVIPEPPVAEDDTRPSPSVTPAEPEQTVSPPPQPITEPPMAEPDFLAGVPAEDDTPIQPEPTRVTPAPPVSPAPPPTPSEPVQEPPPVTAEDDFARFRPPPVPALDNTPAIIEPVAQEQPESSTPAPPPIPEPAAEVPPVAGVPDDTRENAPIIETDDSQRATSESAKLDTSEVSIWEVFGMPRPSETQEMAAVKLDEVAAAPIPESEPEPELHPQPVERTAPAITTSIIGLRIRLRRKLVRLRRSQ